MGSVVGRNNHLKSLISLFPTLARLIIGLDEFDREFTLKTTQISTFYEESEEMFSCESHV